MLVLANGLLTGASFSTATRFTAAARSPLTRAYGESEAGGYWEPELKMAGWEAIIITRRAETPVWRRKRMKCAIAVRSTRSRPAQ